MNMYKTRSKIYCDIDIGKHTKKHIVFRPISIYTDHNMDIFRNTEGMDSVDIRMEDTTCDGESILTKCNIADETIDFSSARNMNDVFITNLKNDFYKGKAFDMHCCQELNQQYIHNDSIPYSGFEYYFTVLKLENTSVKPMYIFGKDIFSKRLHMMVPSIEPKHDSKKYF
jgi:hypothetical protein